MLFGAAFEGESGRPYGPFIDAFRALPGSLELQESRQTSRDQLLCSVATMVAGLVEQHGRLLLVLDDVHWLDEASCTLLHYLCRELRDAPVHFLATARSEELVDNVPLSRILRGLRRDALLDELSLSPLDESSIAQLVEANGGNQSPREVFQQSGGNPLFAHELTRVSSFDSLPRSAAEAVRDRIARLPPAALDILRWSSVLGKQFEASALFSHLGLDEEEMLDALELLERHSILKCHGEIYSFSHDILQRVVYDGLSVARRRLMHRKIAERLSLTNELSAEAATSVARHAALGQDHALATQACIKAGNYCLRLFAYRSARLIADRGLEHANQLEPLERIKAQIELLEVQVSAYPLTDKRHLVEQLEPLAERALQLGADQHASLAYYLLGHLSYMASNFQESQRRVMQSTLVSQKVQGLVRVEALAESGRCLVALERDLPSAHAMLKEAEALSQGQPTVPSSLHDGLGGLLLFQGRLDEALTKFEQARLIAQSEGRPAFEFHVLEHMVMVALEQSDYDRLAHVAEELIRLGGDQMDEADLSFAHSVAAVARYGKTPASSRDELERCLGALRDEDSKFRLGYLQSFCALVDLGQADIERALRRSQEALTIARLMQRPSETLRALVITAAAERARNTPDTKNAALIEIDAHHWSVSHLVQDLCEKLLHLSVRRDESPAMIEDTPWDT